MSQWNEPGRFYSDREIVAIREKAFEEARKYCANMEADRNNWIRLFNRLDAAVSRHRMSRGEFSDDWDDALHAAHDRILKSAAEGVKSSAR